MKTLFLIALFAALPLVSHAQGTEFVPLTTLPGLQAVSDSASLAPFLSQIYKMCIGLAAVLAVLQLMRAGVLYMGGDSITEKKQAKDLIAVSLAGLLLVLSPVIVFGIINPKILQLDIDASGLTSQQGPTAVDNVSLDGLNASTGDGSCSMDCANGLICKAGACVAPSTASCTAISNGTVITADQYACCTKQPNYHVESAVSGGALVSKCMLRLVAPAPIQVTKYTYIPLSGEPKDLGPVPADKAKFDAFSASCKEAKGTLQDKWGQKAACSAEVLKANPAPGYNAYTYCSPDTVSCIVPK